MSLAKSRGEVEFLSDLNPSESDEILRGQVKGNDQADIYKQTAKR
jgi:hypothetical protein